MEYLNKKAKFNYRLDGEVEAGISLEGSEAKAIREQGINLSNSFVKIIGNEAFLINADISIPGKKDYNSTRTRKLLLKKEEILSFSLSAKAKSLTIVPVKLYNKGRFYKVKLALGKPRKKFEKKEAIKKRDIEREIDKQLKDNS